MISDLIEQYKDRIMKNLKEAGKDDKDISISASCWMENQLTE